MNDYVRLVGMERRIILMVCLGNVEATESGHLGHDWPAERLCRCQLIDVRLGDPLLRIARVINRGSVLSSDIGTLAIELSRIVGYGEKTRSS